MSEAKNILIVSNACYPELSPRAFRTTELVRELVRQGHRVTLVLPNREQYHRYPLEVAAAVNSGTVSPEPTDVPSGALQSGEKTSPGGRLTILFGLGPVAPDLSGQQVSEPDANDVNQGERSTQNEGESDKRADGKTDECASSKPFNERNLSEASGGWKARLRHLMPRFLVRWILYFYNHELYTKYDRGLARRLTGLDGTYDAVISISYPAAIHRAVSKAFRRNPALTGAVRIAEFSDPPFRGDIARKVFPAYYRYLKRWGREFDFIVVPVDAAVPFYTPYVDPRKIRVIPQGFDLTAVRTLPYAPHDKPTFAYAGRFYERIRDPKFFFDFLKTTGKDFRFELYLNHITPYFSEMIERARRETRGEIIVHEALPREELISELSRFDFLVNFENTTSNATPSKLIDYALTGRPILSLNSVRFDSVAAIAFLDGDYSGQVRGIDPADYDIRRVAGRFMELIEEARR